MNERQSVSCEVVLRPVKLALLVRDGVEDDAMAAIELASGLWGGMFDPIVPIPADCFGETNNDQHDRIVAAVRSYLDVFDPDILVNLIESAEMSASVLGRRVIDADEIVPELESSGHPHFGVSIQEILADLESQEFRFVRRDDRNIKLPAWAPAENVFLAAAFGTVSEQMRSRLQSRFQRSLGLDAVDLGLRNYAEHLEDPSLLFTHIGRTDCRIYTAGTRRTRCLLVVDAWDVSDAVEYWNCRALGWDVLPVADSHVLASEVACRFARSKPAEPATMFTPGTELVVQKAKNCPQTRFEEVVSAFEELVINENGRWNSWRVRANWSPIVNTSVEPTARVSCSLVDSHRRSYVVPDEPASVIVPALVPPFLEEEPFRSACFVNEVRNGLFRESNGIRADVLPQGDERTVSPINDIDKPTLRVSQRGVVHFCSGVVEELRLSTYEGEFVFAGWMRRQGITCSLSPEGRLAKELFRWFGDVKGLSLLANEAMIDFLRLVADGRFLTVNQLRGHMMNVARKAEVGDADFYVSELIARGILQLGLKVQCPTCQRHSWFALQSFGYTLTCPVCVRDFAVPVRRPVEMRWAYRAVGPFVAASSHGSLSVLLALRFFSKTLHSTVTPMLSFNASGGGKKVEVDLGLLHRAPGLYNTAVNAVFIECKSDNAFGEADVERMEWLAKLMPRSIFVFACLREELTPPERQLIRAFAGSLPPPKGATGMGHHVAILTRVELLATHSLSDAWSRASRSPLHKTYANPNARYVDLTELCEATQALYLSDDRDSA